MRGAYYNKLHFQALVFAECYFAGPVSINFTPMNKMDIGKIQAAFVNNLFIGYSVPVGENMIHKAYRKIVLAGNFEHRRWCVFGGFNVNMSVIFFGVNFHYHIPNK
jgi:hypothetical protein